MRLHASCYNVRVGLRKRICLRFIAADIGASMAPRLENTASTKTLRFSDLVKMFGRPEAVTLWQDPQADKPFMRAVQQNRVLTVKQPNVGTQKDYGIVGFRSEPSASFLIFPKSLAAAPGTKVVGIKYELLAQPSPAEPISPSERVKRVHAPREQPRTERPKSIPETVSVPPKIPPPKKFKITIRCNSTVDLIREVEARTLRAARAKALEEIARQPVDFSAGQITRRPIHTQKVRR